MMTELGHKLKAVPFVWNFTLMNYSAMQQRLVLFFPTRIPTRRQAVSPEVYSQHGRAQKVNKSHEYLMFIHL